MKNIRITDNVQEMVAIGHELCQAHSSLYEQMGGVVLGAIRTNWPHLTDEEAERVFYRSIYDYWVYGARIDEWFLYRFFEKGHEQKDEYVTTRRKFQYVRHLNNENDRHLMDDKYETYKLLRPYYKRDMISIKGEQDFPLFRDFCQQHPVCVVKPTDATYGQGVYKLEVSSNLEAEFEALLEKNKTTKRDSLTNSDGILLEELIIQDESLAALHPNSVQCLRCNTLLVKGEAHVFATSMKVGVGNQFVTSISGGSLTVGINTQTGIMETGGFSEVFGLEDVATHPDSGITFVGYQIPKWNEMITMAKEIALQIPTIGYVAWDLALSEKGWCVIEGNYAGEFFGMQLPYKKGIKPRLENVLNWKPAQQFWWQE